MPTAGKYNTPDNNSDFFESDTKEIIKNKSEHIKTLTSEESDHKLVSFIKLKDDGKTEIRYIYHLSDIHIRNTQRHIEYNQVFEQLYIKLKSLIGSNKKQSLIILTGDIMHTKTELSPEAISIACQFFKSLNEIASVILIPGNHDCNLSNKNRLDALTPIVEDLTNFSNFYYLKKSGLYQYYNIVFGITSVFDDILISANKITDNVWTKISQKNKYKIALYHGPVHGAKTDVGYRMNNEQLIAEDFDGYHYVLLGDIHKHQYLNKDQTIAYAGSLIQQSYGEKLTGHGVLRWDLTDGESELVEIKNDYGYCTVNIVDGKMIETKIPRKPRIRFILENTNQIQYQDVLKNLENQYQISEVVKESNFKTKLHHSSPSQKKLKEEVTAYDTQEKIIKSYLKKNDLEKEKITEIIELHKKIYQKILSDKKDNVGDIMHNAIKTQKWKILELRFTNTLSYGKDNVIDFRNYDPNKIIGIVAPNHYGKSAILDIILFCLFDKLSRGDRRDILNKNEKYMYCSLLLAVGNQQYLIEKIGLRNKNGMTVKIDVNFYQIKIDKKGNEIKEKMNGLDKNDTNKKISELIGDYNDYLTTCFCLQHGKSSNFIDMTQMQKKEYLNEVLKLNVFEDCYNMAKDKLKKLTGELNILEQKVGSKTLEELKTSIKTITKEIKIMERQKELTHTNLTSVLDFIINELSQNQLVKYNDLSKYVLESEDDIIKTIADIKCKLQQKTISNISKIKKELEQDKNELINIETENKKSSSNITMNDLMIQKETLVKKLIPISKIISSNTEQYQKEKLQLLDRINVIEKTLDTYQKNNLDAKLEKIEHLKQTIDKLRNKLKPINQNSREILADSMNKKREYEKLIYTSIDDALSNSKILSIEEKKILENEMKVRQNFSKHIQGNINELKSYQNSSHIVNDKIVNKIKQVDEKWMNSYQKWLERSNKLCLNENRPNVDELIKNSKLISDQIIINTIGLFNYYDNQVITKKINIAQQELDSLAEFHGTKKEIDNLKNEKNLIKEKIGMLENKIKEIETCMANTEINKKIQQEIDNIQEMVDKEMDIINKVNKLVKNLKQKITNNEKLMKDYDDVIKERAILRKDLKLTSEYHLVYQSWFLKNYYLKNWIEIKKKYDADILNMGKELDKKHIQLTMYKKELDQYLSSRKEFDDKITQTNLYQLYVKVMNYNGLPYEMLKTYLPLIEADVNQILHSMVNFNIEFMFYDEEKLEEQKSKNLKSNMGCIDVNICYQDKKPYNVQLSSGFERFIIGLAIRMTLCQVSLTAKPNFLIIDEGWSCMDSENLNNIGNIMAYIKSQYEHVIIISHIEELRGQADYVINIEKNNGYSYIKSDKKIKVRNKRKNNAQKIIQI